MVPVVLPGGVVPASGDPVGAVGAALGVLGAAVGSLGAALGVVGTVLGVDCGVVLVAFGVFMVPLVEDCGMAEPGVVVCGLVLWVPVVLWPLVPMLPPECPAPALPAAPPACAIAHAPHIKTVPANNNIFFVIFSVTSVIRTHRISSRMETALLEMPQPSPKSRDCFLATTCRR